MKFYYYETTENVRLDLLSVFKQDDGIHYCETGYRLSLSLDEDNCSDGQGMILFSKEDANKFARAAGKSSVIVNRKNVKIWFIARGHDDYVCGDYTEFKCGTICRRHYTIADYTKFKGFIVQRGYSDFYRRGLLYSCDKTLEEFKMFQQQNSKIYFNYEATNPIGLNLIKGVNGR